MNRPVTVVIPHFRAETLTECLRSLYAHSEMPLRVIVVDDGQDAPSLRQARSAFPQAEVLRNETNLGFSASCNRGLEAATGDYAVLLNDDTRVAHDPKRRGSTKGNRNDAVSASCAGRGRERGRGWCRCRGVLTGHHTWF